MNPFTFMAAFKRGKELTNVSTWKQVAWTSGSISIILRVIVYLLPMFGVDFGDKITDEAIQNISDGIASTLAGLAIVLIPATTTKIGALPASREKK